MASLSNKSEFQLGDIIEIDSEPYILCVPDENKVSLVCLSLGLRHDEPVAVDAINRITEEEFGLMVDLEYYQEIHLIRKARIAYAEVL